MTKIKLCGISRLCDIETINELKPDYIGFVFVPHSSRRISAEKAAYPKTRLHCGIAAVGVFCDEDPKTIVQLLTEGTIDAVQLHGREDAAYIRRLRSYTDGLIIQAFRIDGREDLASVEASLADIVLLDSGTGGTGNAFDWNLVCDLSRPFFLAGGLRASTVCHAIETLHPYAVDVSSGIETDGKKDRLKMREFVQAVRNADAR